MTPDPTLIGIFGTGRNGSTLLLRLLDGVGGVYAHPVECNFLSVMNDLAWRPTVRRRVIQNAVVTPLRLLDRPISMRRLMRFYTSHVREIEDDHLPLVDGVSFGPAPLHDARRQARMRPEAFIPALFSGFARWLLPGQETEAVIFKSIETPYIADYARLLPEMRFVHIIRDPVAVWASVKRSMVSTKGLPPWYLGGDNLRSTLDARWLPHARFLATGPSPARHLVLRYEDLIRAPTTEIARICAWLGLDPKPESDTQTILGRHPNRMPANPSERGVETPRRAVNDLHSTNRFSEVVSARERDLIVLATWTLARRFGYFEGETLPKPSDVRRAWRTLDEWDFRNVSGATSWVRGFASLLARRRFVRRCCRTVPA